MDYERLIDDNCVLISLIACSMNYETAVTFTHGHFNKVVFAVKARNDKYKGTKQRHKAFTK